MLKANILSILLLLTLLFLVVNAEDKSHSEQTPNPSTTDESGKKEPKKGGLAGAWESTKNFFGGLFKSKKSKEHKEEAKLPESGDDEKVNTSDQSATNSAEASKSANTSTSSGQLQPK